MEALSIIALLVVVGAFVFIAFDATKQS